MFRGIVRRKLSAKTHHALNEWVEQTFTDSGKLSHEKHIVLSTPVASAIHSGYAVQGDNLGHEIARCFGLEEAGKLIRKEKRDSSRVIFKKRFANNSVPVEHKLVIGAQKTEFRTTIPEGVPIRIDVDDPDEAIRHLRHSAAKMRSTAIDHEDQPREKRSFLAWQLLETLAGFVQSQVVAPLHHPAFYLPADRTSVMHAHSVVVSALIESAAMTGLRPAARTTPMLSGVLADFLEQLIGLDQPRYYRRRKLRQNPSTQIEQAILSGSVHVDRSEAIGYPRFTYRPKGWKEGLPLMNASSMVSELAPVVLYLRHIVGPGNMLIVEEPESHLHPSMQVEFTRQLAALVNSGIRVLITTHSEWVLEELANIVRRSELPKPSRKDIAAGNVALRSDQVGAWLFLPQRRPKGSVVKEIRLDDSGLYPSGFGEVAAALHNNWAEISSRIGETE